MRYWKPKTIPGVQRVGLAVATYLGTGDARGPAKRRRAALECLVASVRAQTYGDWRLRITHDGPADPEAKAMAAGLTRDERVTWVETPERKQQFGHPHRPAALKALAADGCVWLGTTNDDCYYVPVYLEALISTAVSGAYGRPTDFVYCDCVHSHKLWRQMVTRPRYRHLDLGGFLVGAPLALKVPFDKTTFAADGDWIDRLAAKARSVKKVDAVLYVHN